MTIQKNKSQISLLFVGDVMFGGEYEKYVTMHNVDYSHTFNRVKNLFNEAHVVFCNLESPLFRIDKMRERGAILYSPPESLSALKTINCNIANIGNNHINDYGDESLIRTKQYLEENGFLTIGAGKDITEASEQKIMDIQGVKIGFLSFTSSSTSAPEVASIIATKNTAGCASFDDILSCSQKIRELKKEVDYLVVSLHWGYQHYYYPSPEQIGIAHKMIEEGVDVIIGHHPHVIQGVENYKQGIIFYSLGNFFFPDFETTHGYVFRWNRDTKNSFAAKLCLDSEGQMRYSLIPFTSDNSMVTPLLPPKRERFKKYILSLSSGIKNEHYNQFWELSCNKREEELKRIETYKVVKNMLFEALTSRDGIKNIIRTISIKKLMRFLKICLRK